MKQIIGIALLLIVTASTSACSVAPGAVLKTRQLEDLKVVATDSRLRVVTNTGLGGFSSSGRADPVAITCTEPSPDVAVAAANSLATGLSVLGQGAGTLSFQSVEGLAQLAERTASIQLLRDKMHQTCLAYANGAISGTTYTLIMSRLDDTIVSLLLGETAGGAFGRSLAGIGTQASAEAQATLIGLPAGVEEMVDLTDELALAQKEVDQRQQALATTKAERDKTEEGSEARRTEEEKVTAAEGDLEEAQAQRDELLQRLQSRADASAKAAGEVKQIAVGGGLSRMPSAELARELAEIQENFLMDDFTDSFVSACLVEMGNKERDTASLGAEIDAQVTRLSAVEERIEAVAAELAGFDAAMPEAKTRGERTVAEARDELSRLVMQRDALRASLTAITGLSVGQVLASDEFLRRYGAGAVSLDLYRVVRDNPKFALPDLVQAANMSRGSELVFFCQDKLLSYMDAARQNFHDYRTRRIELDAQMRNAAAQAEVATQATLKQGLEICATKEMTTEQRMQCIALVLGRSPKAADPVEPLTTAEGAQEARS